MINPYNLFIRHRIVKYLILFSIPVGIALYITYPLLNGDYNYSFAEYELLKAFMINFIEKLRHGKLLIWNEYVGNGYPGMYFGHYPITQNTIFYMIFGYSDFTYYFTKFISIAILLLGFIYVCKYFNLSYFYALSGALVYFCVNFVARTIIAETVGNLYPIFPLLAILVIYLVADKNSIRKKEVVIFSLFYILWLSGGHLTYELMPMAMLSVVYWIAIFVFHYKSIRLVDFTRFTGLYFILFVVPVSAVIYQYYFVYDVISDCNRFKPGLIVSPFESIAWKQLFASFHSSSYFWVGLFCCIIYAIVEVISKRNICSKTKQIKIYSLLILLILPLYYFISSIAQIEKLGENIVINGEFSEASNALESHKSTLLTVPGGQTGNCIKITADENAIGYAYFVVPTETGSKYRFTACYKNGSAANSQIKVGTSIDATNMLYSGVLSNSNWTRYNGVFSPATRETYVTLVNLTSVKDQTSFFDTITLKKLEPLLIADSDYIPILGSTVFKIALISYIIIILLVLLKRKAIILEISFSSLLNSAVVHIVYISLLSYYFFSPENIIGDVNGYDYDLFRELSPTLQMIFCLAVLFSIEDYQKRKQVKIVVLSLIALYLIRSHFTIPLMRFTGIIWYATRDGTIFSLFFAVLFMFGLRNGLNHLGGFFRNSKFIKYAKYTLLCFLIILITRDSHNKFYKGTSHRFIFPQKMELVRPEVPMDKGVIDLREEMYLLNDKLLELDRATNHFYKIFSPLNSFAYLAGSLQNHKIYEAFLYDSTISKQLHNFYHYTILNKKPVKEFELKEALPYFLFTKHVHAGINLHSREIPYGAGSFFLYSPEKDLEYLSENQNIEFMWDLMQVKYIIVGSRFSKVLDSYTTRHQYKLLAKYSKLGLELYEITKVKNYSTLAILPVDNEGSYDKIIADINSKDIKVLKSLYKKLVFLDRNSEDFTLLSSKRASNKRYYEIRSTRNGLLIEFESWNKNWALKTNGEKESVLKAFQIFKGIKINPGLNKIEISYTLKFFNLLFLFSFIVILFYFFLLVKYRYF
jgi:hypothetical protein